jgi:hypothetical protein
MRELFYTVKSALNFLVRQNCSSPHSLFIKFLMNMNENRQFLYVLNLRVQLFIYVVNSDLYIFANSKGKVVCTCAQRINHYAMKAYGRVDV